jgi:glycosyltransferase involved in cell wall biosynthesis
MRNHPITVDRGKELLVSVVVPTYNRAHLIGRTLDSILNQSYSNLELIIVDDGSTDDTVSVISTYTNEASFPVRYHKKENGGCSSARNMGVDLATGDAIAFLDSDDEWLPEAIENLVKTIEETGADFVYSPSIVQNNEKHFIAYPAAAGHPELFAVEYFFTTRAYACSILYRKHIFEVYRNDESLRYNEDSDFLQKVAISFKAAYLDIPTALIHHHGANKSLNRIEINRALLRSAQNILETFPAFREQMAELADKRIAGIVTELADELILERRFEEVMLLEASYDLNLLEKLSIHFQTTHLVKAVRSTRLLTGIISGVAGKIFSWGT